MPRSTRHTAEQPPTVIGNRGPDTAAVERIDAAGLWEAVCRISGDSIAVVDRAGMIRFCSRVDDGWSPEQVVGRNMVELLMPEAATQMQQVIEEVFTTGQGKSLETTVRRPDGGLDDFALRLGPVLAEGRPAAILVCCENILPLKTSEKSLQHERTLLRRLLKIQERERQLVSYEIHDGLAQYLAGAIMHLEAAEHAAIGSAEGHDLAEGLRLLRAATDEARRLIGGLRPPALDELGIIEAIETLVSDARIDVPRIDFIHHLPRRRLPPDVETTIFRIVQESLSNIRRHANAEAVSVRLEQLGDDAVRVVVQDDGVGFETATVPDDRFGLEGIRQRARLLGGEPTITSGPGHGTTVSATLPIESGESTQAD
jgi:PAS domain S-box-containing protein